MFKYWIYFLVLTGISLRPDKLLAATLVLERVLYLEDAAHVLTPEQAASTLEIEGAPFTAIADSYSDSYHWFLLEMQAEDQMASSAILHIQNPLISELQAWRREGSQLIPLNTDELRHRHPLLFLQTQPGAKLQVLLKIFLPDMTVLKLELKPPAVAPSNSPLNSFSFAFMLAGFAAGLLIYNLIIFRSVRDLDLANFSLYAFTLILASFGATGGLVALGLPSWVNLWFSAIASISMASALNFTRSFFEIKSKAPRFDKCFFAIEISNILCGLLLAFNVSRKLQYLVDLNVIISLMLCLSFATLAWRRGYPLARTYTLGMVGYIAVLFAYLGLQYGWIQRNIWTENAPLFALNFQILVLSSAIGSKITYLRTKLLSQLREANTALEKKVEERTRTVFEQQQTMIQTAKMASLGEMAGGIAHEINNPLMIINGYAENLATLIQKEQLTQDRAMAFHNRIQKAIDRIRKIVSSLQNLSRDATNDECHDTKLSELLRDALSLCENRFSTRGVTVRVRLPEPDLSLYCNAGQVCQVLINILNNAFDAIENQEDPWVEIRAEDLGEYARLRLFDCGRGIPSDVVQRIFDPFFTTKEIGKGTGLGLSISKSLIERQGGRIYVDQDQPHTCFVLELQKAQNLGQNAA